MSRKEYLLEESIDWSIDGSIDRWSDQVIKYDRWIDRQINIGSILDLDNWYMDIFWLIDE